MQLRHASDWVVRLGDGTAESRERMEAAVAKLWPYAAELMNEVIVGTDQTSRNAQWWTTVRHTFEVATLHSPDEAFAPVTVALTAKAHEYRATLLTEMQSLARQHPGASW